MINNLRLITLFIIVLFSEHSCSDVKDELSFKRVAPTKQNRVSIDTLGLFPEKDMSIVVINQHRGIDDFTWNLVFAKGNEYFYQIQNSNGLSYRLSDEYLAYVEDPKFAGYGWFAIEDGIILNKLDNIDGILDSLKVSYKEYFIRETNGYIDFYLSGKVQKRLNYGDFILDNKDTNVDSLGYGLYRFESGALKLLSDNGNDIKNQKEGVFFVPSPGYGIIVKYRIEDILNVVDSVSKLVNPPNDFVLKNSQIIKN